MQISKNSFPQRMNNVLQIRSLANKMFLHCELIDNCGSLKCSISIFTDNAKMGAFLLFDPVNTGLIQTKFFE